MALQSFDRPLFMIGCGNMAGAMLGRWLDEGLRPNEVTVVDPGSPRLAPGITGLNALPDTIADNSIILLGVKPQLLPEVAPALAPLLGSGHMVISMLAGVTIDTLRASLGSRAEIIRVMPNTPVALGKGICALFAAPDISDAARAQAGTLMEPLGLTEWIKDEGQFNLITALSGCGPAFVFRFIDTLAQAAADLGLEPAQALRMAIATVDGASALAAHADVDPATLADRVASKGGMTREGLDVLDANARLANLIADTLRAARDRGVVLEEMSR